MVVWNTAMILILGVLISAVSAKLERIDHPTKGNETTLGFLVVGDWGGNKEFNQSQVAFQMGRIGEELDIDFVVSTGDNFYKNGLKGVDDPKFVKSFTDIYTAKSLQKPWYSVLGNLDYRGDAKAQLSPLLRKLDSRWLCLKSFIVNADIAEFFFVDTTPFVNEYFTNPGKHNYDWSGVSPVENYTANLLNDLDSALKESKAKWKIVVGHHAIRSGTHHGDTQELVDRLLPILRANNVDLYMNGHDHCLQRISDNLSPIQFLTSGAGSKSWRWDVSPIQFRLINTTNEGSLDFFHDGHGFMSVRLTRTNMETIFYDVFGKVLHTRRQGRS